MAENLKESRALPFIYATFSYDTMDIAKYERMQGINLKSRSQRKSDENPSLKAQRLSESGRFEAAHTTICAAIVFHKLRSTN
jgi:hypothetical protein